MMDKIREEFEIIKPELIEDFLQDKDNVNLMFAGFKACAKSRDKEIKKLKEALEEIIKKSCSPRMDKIAEEALKDLT